MALVFELGVNSSTAIQLEPEYDYKKVNEKIETVIRTKSGRAKKYKWGEFKSFSFSVKFLPSSAATIINSWYDTDTKLLFFITSDTATEVYSVMIMGDKSPFQGFIEPYDDLWDGKIDLETY